MGSCERYQVLFKINFEIIDPGGVNQKKGNRLTKELVERLKSFKFERHNIRAWNSDVDDLEIWQPSPNLAEGSLSTVMFEVLDVDPDESKRVYAYNNLVKGKIAAEIKSWTFTHYATKLSVTQIEHS